MALLDNLEAEAKMPSGWTRIGIEGALRLDGVRFRCLACHGPMRAHKKAHTGQRAHFEHRNHHSGCPKGDGYSGTPSPHPDALA